MLLVSSPGNDRVLREDVDGQHYRRRHVGGPELLHHKRPADVAEAATTDRLRERRAGQPQLTHPVEDRPVEALALVPIRGTGRDLATRELAGSVAEQSLLIGQWPAQGISSGATGEAGYEFDRKWSVGYPRAQSRRRPGAPRPAARRRAHSRSQQLARRDRRVQPPDPDRSKPARGTPPPRRDARRGSRPNPTDRGEPRGPICGSERRGRGPCRRRRTGPRDVATEPRPRSRRRTGHP